MLCEKMYYLSNSKFKKVKYKINTKYFIQKIGFKINVSLNWPKLYYLMYGYCLQNDIKQYIKLYYNTKVIQFSK